MAYGVVLEIEKKHFAYKVRKCMIIILLFWLLDRTLHFMPRRCHQQRRQASHLLVVVGIFSCILNQGVCSASVVSVFPQQSDTSVPLRNFVFDSIGRKLYVGGVNVIYKLDENLQQDAAVMLGPHRDIVDCADASAFSLNCTLASETSDSNSQALALDIDSEVLIACGTLYYGSCAKINTADFSAAEYVYRPVVPNDRSKSVAILVAPGFTGTSLLYVGAAYSTVGVDALRSRVGLFSVRNLETFEVASVETSSSSFIQIRPDYHDNFAMHFIRAYHFNTHVYFFFRRPSQRAVGEITSHVLRVCTDDRRMYSIVELHLECSVGNDVYRYLRDVTLIDFDPPLQMNDDSSVTGPTLVGTFTSTAEDAGSSAVCLFQMSDVEVGFQSVIQNCYRGRGFLGPEYIAEIERCTETVGCFCFIYCFFCIWF